MLLISHRGNIDSVDSKLENTHAYIDAAITAGYDVEMDVWRVGDALFLGHDKPEWPTTIKWLQDRKSNLWIHTKNFGALSYLIDKDVRVFYHQHEKHTIINNCNIIWSHELSQANEKSIIPLLSLDDISLVGKYPNVYGVCSDFVSHLKDV